MLFETLLNLITYFLIKYFNKGNKHSIVVEASRIVFSERFIKF